MYQPLIIGMKKLCIYNTLLCFQEKSIVIGQDLAKVKMKISVKVEVKVQINPKVKKESQGQLQLQIFIRKGSKLSSCGFCFI